MVTKKRKKVTRQRAHTTHGWGAMKKHRGAGNRGGVGNAGSGKRGDCKKPSYWADKNHFGMHGFKKKGQVVEYKCINIICLNNLGKSDINLADLGYNKLLGTGKPNKAYTITVDYASARAIAKIEEAKGKVVLLKVSKKKQTKAATVEKKPKIKAAEASEEDSNTDESDEPKTEDPEQV